MQIFDNGGHRRAVKALSDVRMHTFLRCNSPETKLQKFLIWRSNTDEQKIWGLTVSLK